MTDARRGVISVSSTAEDGETGDEELGELDDVASKDMLRSNSFNFMPAP